MINLIREKIYKVEYEKYTSTNYMYIIANNIEEAIKICKDHIDYTHGACDIKSANYVLSAQKVSI
jgi:hypothetical protein